MPQPKNPKKSGKSKVHANVGPFQVAAVWPHDQMPFAFWGGKLGKAIIPTALKVVRPSDFFAIKFSDFKSSSPAKPQYIGMISYDEFSPSATNKTPSIIFEIHSYLIWENDSPEPRHEIVGQPNSCPLKLEDSQLKDIFASAREVELISPKGNVVFPSLSDESYLSAVADILEMIRKGNFYQMNFLRWYRLAKSWNWSQVCARLKEHGGKYASILRRGNTSIVSFSPERFVSIVNSKEQRKVSTWPIKGTASRNISSPDLDKDIADELSNSKKDRAELNMIIDLMRNDLFKVCKPLTVKVANGGNVVTHKHVHHLEGQIEGELKDTISFHEFFTALCPGGSITGAPKLEVMEHIRLFEGRDRGFFMGVGFLLEQDGTFDSNILIRTMVSQDGCRSWEYAAGSGIVIKSSPEAERLEILAKCRPITE